MVVESLEQTLVQRAGKSIRSPIKVSALDDEYMTEVPPATSKSVFGTVTKATFLIELNVCYALLSSCITQDTYECIKCKNVSNKCTCELETIDAFH